MKTIKRALSLLLALLMVLSLSPAPFALAEEPEGTITPVTAAPVADETQDSCAFILQPQSGSHAPGETYLVTWELSRLPDQLELVREEPVGADALGGPQKDENGEPETVLVFERELDPADTELELTAPKEETVWRLRAFCGEDELVSDAFTVTLLPEEEWAGVGKEES